MQYDFTKDSVLKPAYDYWRSKRGGRTIPRRRDIEPTEIPRLLPNIQITELLDGGKRIRFRLAGSAIVHAYGSELAGKHFDEIFTGERLKFAEENYRIMCERKRPVLVVNRYHSARDVELICNRLIMPLSDDDATVNQCLTAMSFEFPGKSGQSIGHWSENSADFDVAMSYCKAIEIDQDG
ncbi:MAG TPA: PAS domain-containing protein [Stellaceae bacterium]|nr:PAS domain-containing protein [Stellaceae bacterium]